MKARGETVRYLKWR